MVKDVVFRASNASAKAGATCVAKCEAAERISSSIDGFFSEQV